MSDTVVLKCEACGQGFNRLNKPIGDPLNPSACTGGHRGPFPVIPSHLQEKEVVPSINDMLQSCGIKKPNEHIVERMVKRYGFLVDLAHRTKDCAMMKNVYHQTEALPNTQTSNQLNIEGYFLDGHLMNGNDCLQICFNKSVPYLMKVCTEEEYLRAREFKRELTEKGLTLPSSIISFQLFDSGLKRYSFMPLHPITLENNPLFEVEGLRRFFYQMSSALNFLHSCEFAHMDVKPSNILISTSGDFILADLGSLVRFNARSSSTPCYLPDEMYDNAERRGPLASASVDWWMLAVTIYEKACGGVIGGKSPSKSDVINRISGNGPIATLVPKEIVDELLSRLM